MNKRRVISTLFVLAVIVVAGYVYRSSFRLPLATAKVAETTIANEIGPHSNISYDTGDLDELTELIRKTIKAGEWTVIGSPTTILKSNQLIETDANEAELVLTLGLFRGDAMLATQTRYFANHHGADKEVTVPSTAYLVCAMYANGFLSGTCDVVCKSDKEVALSLDWVFDDIRAKHNTIFRCDIDATVAGSGIVDCENGEKVHWKLERKATEQM